MRGDEVDMNNMLDYVKWRGDLSFKKAAMNEVDGMIFAKLSYVGFEVFFDGLEKADEAVNIADFADCLKRSGKPPINMLLVKTSEYEDLLNACAKSHRFGKVKISDYVNIYEPAREMQFSAVTFETDDKSVVVAFRGTDDTVAGWKEDFNMGFLETVPSQEESVRYLNRIAEKFPDRKLITLGHSKGGNLALFSSIMSPLKVNSRITRVYNYDGPGFIGNIDSMPTYKRLIGRITTLVPESSIIGMLLERREKTTVVKSNATGGFNQHSGFTWEVMGTKFIRLETIDAGSRMLDTALKSYLNNSTIEQRRNFADALSAILSGYEGCTLTELTADKIKVINSFTKSIEGLDKETKNVLVSSIRLVFTEGIKGVRNAPDLTVPAVRAAVAINAKRKVLLSKEPKNKPKLHS